MAGGCGQFDECVASCELEPIALVSDCDGCGGYQVPSTHPGSDSIKGTRYG